MSSNRKDALRALMLGGAGEGAPGQPAPTPAAPAAGAVAGRSGSGAVKAMGLQLSALRDEADEAARLKQRVEALQEQAARASTLEQALADAEAVVELDPGLIDASFARDRLRLFDGPADRALRDSIAAHGQQVPILVRPHPDRPGRWQCAYGHRRLQACFDLRRPVRAVVRPLDDAALVIAQGKENAEREDLSFIERASFAATLEAAGFDRRTIMAALGVETAEITRFLAVMRALPAELVGLVGPAPKAGRPRWMRLAELLRDHDPDGRHWGAVAREPTFLNDPSDRRFQRVFAALEAAARAPLAETPDVPALWKGAGDRVRVAARRSAGGARLSFSAPDAPEFAEHVMAALDALYADFLKRRKARAGPRARGL